MLRNKLPAMYIFSSENDATVMQTLFCLQLLSSYVWYRGIYFVVNTGNKPCIRLTTLQSAIELQSWAWSYG